MPQGPVSYVMPVLNEEAHVAAAVQSVLRQDVHPFELLLVCGESSDGTDDVVDAVVKAHPEVRRINNPRNAISVAMNLGLAEAKYDIVVRVDAHSELPADYTAKSLRALRESGAVNVGGRMVAQGTTPFERAVAFAYNTWWGLGGGVYHVGGEEGEAESAYLGVYEKAAVIGVGGYDEALSRGEDWELNLRLRRSGRIIWFLPDVVVTYRPRSSVRAVAKQFHASGRWRGTLIRRDLRATPMRYLAPPALLVAIVASAVTAVIAGLSSGASAIVLGVLAAAVPAAYVSVLVAASIANGLDAPTRLRIPWVLALIHLAWGYGCLAGMMRTPRRHNQYAGR